MNGMTVRAIRNHYRLGQASFAKRIGVKQPTLSAVECGMRPVSRNVKVRIAQEFPITDEVIASIQRTQTLSKLEDL